MRKDLFDIGNMRPLKHIIFPSPLEMGLRGEADRCPLTHFLLSLHDEQVARFKTTAHTHALRGVADEIDVALGSLTVLYNPHEHSVVWIQLYHVSRNEHAGLSTTEA